MREIPLTRGQVALVDDADYERVSQFRWRLHSKGYAATSTTPTIYIHRLILQVPPGYVSDHKNGDKLDNRRMNLRVATIAENNQNRRRSNTTKSLFKGVDLLKWGRYRAKIVANSTYIYIGCFATAEEAARAYDAKARELHGAFARLNFPEPGEQAA